MKKKSLSRSVQHGCPSHLAGVEPVGQGDFMFSAHLAGICRKWQQLWVSCHTRFVKPRRVRALQTLVFALLQITLVHWLGEMAEAGGFKVCETVAEWVLSAYLRTSRWCWEGKKNVRYVGKIGEGKECQDGACIGLFLPEILSKAYSFPKQTKQSNSGAHRTCSFFSPLALNNFNTWVKKYRLASRLVACMPFKLLMPKECFFVFLKKSWEIAQLWRLWKTSVLSGSQLCGWNMINVIQGGCSRGNVCLGITARLRWKESRIGTGIASDEKLRHKP